MASANVRINLDLQDCYDQARAAAAAWIAYAETLAELGVVCVHQHAKAVPGAPAVCQECGRTVPALLLDPDDA
jgi:hypothetical protein